MSWSGSGTYNRYFGLPNKWAQDSANATPISSASMDLESNDIATGITNCITKDGQNSPTTDLPMGTHKHTGVTAGTARTHYADVGSIQDGGYIWGGTAGGTATALTIACSPAVPALVTGQTFRFIVASSNTGAATLAVNGLTAKAITKWGTIALVVNDMAANMIAEVVYDGTQFQLNNVFPFAHGADIASAGTTNLSTRTGRYVRVTGTTTITAITLVEGDFAIVEFTGILTLTHNAVIILPSGASITTAAGDIAEFVGYSGGIVKCVSYSRATGRAVIYDTVTWPAAQGSSLVLICKQTAAAASAVDFVNGVTVNGSLIVFDSTYDHYILKMTGVRVQSNAAYLIWRVTENSGGSYAAGGANYSDMSTGFSSGGAITQNGTNSGVVLAQTTNGQSNAASQLYDGELTICNPTSASAKQVFGRATYTSGTSVFCSWSIGGLYNATTNTINGFRIIPSSGQITAGSFALYGVKIA